MAGGVEKREKEKRDLEREKGDRSVMGVGSLGPIGGTR